MKRPLSAGQLTWTAAGALGLIVALLMPNPLAVLGLSPSKVQGGVRMVARAAAPLDAELARKTERWLALRTSRFESRIHFDGESRFEVELGGADRSDAELLAVQVGEDRGLQIRTVVADSPYAQALYRLVQDRQPAGISADVDLWIHEEMGLRFRDPYLMAASRDQLERFVAQANAASALPEIAGELVYEFVTPSSYAHDEEPHWRTYVVAREVSLTHLDIESANVIYNQVTNQPEVLASFYPEGAKRFADLTRQLTGHKIAILVNGQVAVAPSVQSEIRGGEVVIAMGGGSPQDAHGAADQLLEQLRMSAPPVPMAFEDVEIMGASVVLALLLRLLVLLAVAMVVVGLVRTTERAPALQLNSGGDSKGRAPVGALLATLAGPVVLLAGARILLPGVNEIEIRNLLVSTGGFSPADAGALQAISPFALGLMPILTAIVLVEVLALFIPGWRVRRLGDPAARRPLRIAAAAIGLLLAAMQAYFVAVWVESLGFGWGGEIVFDPGTRFRLITIATLVSGTVVLLVLAGVLESRGLVGGFAIVAISSLAFELPSFDVLGDQEMLIIQAKRWLILLSAGGLTWWITGRRVGSLRLPSPGIIPLDWAAALALISAATLSFPGTSWGQYVTDLLTLSHSSTAMAISAVLLSLALAWLFARSIGASLSTIVRSAIVSAVVLLAVLSLAFGELGLDMVIAGCIGGAFARDAWTEWKARKARSDWTPVWVGHQVHVAQQMVQGYADTGVDVFARGIHIRSMLHFFGPFYPITIMVPRDRAGESEDDSDTEAGALAPARVVRAS